MATTAAIKTKREWIYAKKPAGQWYTRRQWVGYSLLLAFLVMPFIKINGNPMLMLNIVERKFSVLGTLFYPQDLYLFVFGMMIMLVSIVLVTAMVGRVWCGWACPQTIFMELVFRRIEYWIEGDWIQQKKLNEGPDTDSRAWKKLLKHALFFLISFLIANLFLAYVIGVDALWKIIAEPVEQHVGGFLSLLLFTGAFYAVFAWFRELVCIAVCPYGRLQGALLDESTISVAYDHRRGEPRGKHRKSDISTTGRGDCVDCKLCVHVCPTGIDIRQGNQLECVNCTACIDACDTVMSKLNKPSGLIGFYSALELKSEVSESGAAKAERTTPASEANAVASEHVLARSVEPTRAEVQRAHKRRMWAYGIVLLALTIVMGVLIGNRSIIDGRLLRATGSSYQLREDGTVSNLYTLELSNKAGADISFALVTKDPGILLQTVNQITSLKRDGNAIMSFFLVADKDQIKKYKTKVSVQVVSNGKVIKVLPTTFMAPVSGRARQDQ